MLSRTIPCIGLFAMAMLAGACASSQRTSSVCPVGGAPGGAACRNCHGVANPACPVGAGTPTGVNGATIALDTKAREALVAALDDERRAQAYYGAVLAKFNGAMPFAQIINAEKRHESHVLALMRKYGVEAPANRWANERLDVPATLAQAAREAARFERENVAMYDGFLEFMPAGDIRATMEQMRRVSLERHLPAFEGAAKRAS